MKRTLTILAVLLTSLGVAAQENAQSQRLEDGFYRVQNHGTKRYAYIYDRLGSIEYRQNSADMGAVVLYHQERHDRFSDPASVCYVQKYAHKHNVFGQNTSFYDIINHYVQIQDAKDSNGVDCYKISPIFAGTYIYLRDGNVSGSLARSTIWGQNNEAETASNFEAFRWDFIPFSSTTDEYLGIAPNSALRIGDKYYKPYIVGFAMKLLSPGMKAYYVSEIKDDAVIIKEYTGDIIPANTPIIVECSTTEPTTNRVELFFDTPPALTDNILSGNYFCYGSHKGSATDRLLYNPSEMRMLAVRDGKLTYVADVNHEYTTFLKLADGENYYVPANESYLRVHTDFPEELCVMTEKEYAAAHGTDTDVYDINSDGSIDLTDLQCIVQMVLGRATEWPRADVNNDGKYSIADVTRYIPIMAGRRTPTSSH